MNPAGGQIGVAEAVDPSLGRRTTIGAAFGAVGAIKDGGHERA
ncbi:MAG: hypothetical protein ACREFD_14000 [Stellaceae bacterium]